MFLMDRIDSPSPSNPGGGITNLSNIIDNNGSTVATITNNSVQIQIDLGSPNIAVSGIRIKTTENSALNNIAISTGTDPNNFTTISTLTLDPDIKPHTSWYFFNFDESTDRYLRFTLTREGNENYTLAIFELYHIVGDFSDDNDHPYIYTPQFHQLQVNNLIKGEFRFEWEKLGQPKVDELEAIFMRNDSIILLPDEDEADAIYDVRWVSAFDFYDTTLNWSEGKSGEVVFDEV